MFNYLLSCYYSCTDFNPKKVDNILDEIYDLITNQSKIKVRFCIYNSSISLTTKECKYICSELEQDGYRVRTLNYSKIDRFCCHNYYYFDIDWTN